MTRPFAALQARLLRHFQAPSTPQARNRATYPVAYTRAAAAEPIQSPDFQALRSSYDVLTAGRCTPVHFVCNGNDATVVKTVGNQFLIRGRVTSRPFDVHAKDDTVWMSSSGASGRNGNTGQLLGHAQQQMLIQAAKFALANGKVGSAAFAPDVRMNGL